MADGSSGVTRLELEQRTSGAFLYLFDDRVPGTPVGEEWYETTGAAREVCARRFGVSTEGWHPLR